MVENQCGLIDIVQSITANVTVRKKMTRPAAGQAFHLHGQRRIAGAVLFGRPGAQALRQEAPDGEVEHVAGDEERHVEVGRLLEDDRVRGLVGPVVEVPHAGQDGQAEERHDRQRARGRFEDAPDHEAPGAAAQVVEHQQRQAAEPDARPVDPGHQVGFVEPIGTRQEEADAGQHGAGRGGHQALRLQTREALGWVVRLNCHVVCL